MQSAHETALALLDARLPGMTICPSEVARAIASDQDWRAAMPIVHAAVDHLLAERLVTISWKGRQLDARTGPYRIGRPLS